MTVRDGFLKLYVGTSVQRRFKDGMYNFLTIRKKKKSKQKKNKSLIVSYRTVLSYRNYTIEQQYLIEKNKHKNISYDNKCKWVKPHAHSQIGERNK